MKNRLLRPFFNHLSVLHYMFASLSVILRVTSSGTFLYRIYTLLVIHHEPAAAIIAEQNHSLTEPTIEFGLAPTIISIIMPDTNELSFSCARTINIYTRVLENWISSSHRRRETAHRMYYIIRTCSIKSCEYIEACSDNNAARVATICNFACWLTEYIILLHINAYVCQEPYNFVKTKVEILIK